MFPGLPERNPGLELANAFSVKERELSPTRHRVVVLTSFPRLVDLPARNSLKASAHYLHEQISTSSTKGKTRDSFTLSLSGGVSATGERLLLRQFTGQTGPRC